jgi:hypothetical protein
MTEIEENLEKIEKLVNSADKFNEMSFRLVLEGLVNKGGEEAEYLLVRYLNSKALDFTTRINIIRVVGYLQSPHFLVPLKKVIDNEDNIHLKREAVISVSKYNDRRALNILNHALASIKNPLLLETINNEIGKIKKNNPVFALLPRFLDGENNPKNFEVTLGILKRILRPSDAAMFISYLYCGKPLIERGAFEILCYTGDLEHQAAILKFFQDQFNQIPCINEPQCDTLYTLALKLKRYFFRHPSLIDRQLDNLGTLLFYVKDDRIRGLFISILCQSRQPPAITFVNKIYDSEAALRETIIIEYSGNEAAVDFLFEKYRAEEAALKGLIIKSLLNSQKGISYFYEHFFSLKDEEKGIVVNCLPYGGDRDLSDFIKMILQSELTHFKETLLIKIREYHYMETITQLFPITSIKKLIEEIAFSDLSVNRVKKYLQRINGMVPTGLTFNLAERGLISMIISKLVMANNVDLTLLFLTILRHVKTFDMGTYTNLNDGVGLFVTQRETKMSVEEGDEVRKIRKNLSDLYVEIRKIEAALKTWTRMFTRVELDFEQVVNFLTQQSLCVTLNIDRVSQVITKRLTTAGREEVKEWLRLFNRFPMIAFRLKDAILEKAQDHTGPESTALLKFHEALPEKPLKILIRLTNKRITSILREQFLELVPDIPVDTETDQLAEDDMLLCDTVTLKDFILKNTLPSQKLFLFLDKISEFDSFKTYNPRPFLKPFSAYRIMREVLKEIYL